MLKQIALVTDPKPSESIGRGPLYVDFWTVGSERSSMLNCQFLFNDVTNLASCDQSFVSYFQLQCISCVNFILRDLVNVNSTSDIYKSDISL